MRSGGFGGELERQGDDLIRLYEGQLGRLRVLPENAVEIERPLLPFRSDLGIREPALERIIHASYHLLGRISFFTVGDDEVRAWTIADRTGAQRAAGAVHSDIERGFIRAELVPYDDLMAAGSWAASRDAGTLRLEGRDYVVQDGDVINFRFNV